MDYTLVHQFWTIPVVPMLNGITGRTFSINSKDSPDTRTPCKPIPCNENRVFPVKFSHREIPVMKTGVPAMRTGVPCNENRFFSGWKTSQGKPRSGPVLALYRIAVLILYFMNGFS